LQFAQDTGTNGKSESSGDQGKTRGIEEPRWVDVVHDIQTNFVLKRRPKVEKPECLPSNSGFFY
jgi:hypothetical protein